MKTILIDVKIHEESLDKLREMSGVEVRIVEPEERVRPLPADDISRADFLFCTFPPENFDAMTSLEWIQIASTGYTQLFNLGLAEKGIRACNARGVFDIPIAEWCMAMMVNLGRDLRGMIRHQEHRIWDRDARFQTEIRGRTVGLWGYGGIGRQVARLAKAMGMKVHIYEPQGVCRREDVYTVAGTGDPQGELPDQVFTAGQEEGFLTGLDFLILAMPLTKKTEGLIGAEELQWLPNHAFLLNPARGPLVQEEALLRALREGWIAGAALDTHYHYPMPADHPLWVFPNVIFTPHISGSSLSPHFTERIWDIFLQNVARYLEGKPLLNELAAAQLKGE